jgi:hypothetical protein
MFDDSIERKSITRRRRVKHRPFRGYLIVHDLAACSTAPTPEQFDRMLWEGFLRDLPRSETKLLDNPDPNLAAYPTLLEKLDAWLLFQLGTVGVAMEASPLFQARKAAWHRGDPRGSEKLRQAGTAIARAAKIWQGRARLPLTDPRLHVTRKILTAELKLLFSRFRNRAETLPVKAERVMELLTADISENHGPELFQAIAAHHLHTLLNFLWNDAIGKHWLGRIRRGEKVRASAFFHDWLGWVLRRDSKKLANIIGAVGSSPH